jgi:steroid delta-isomerase-like uncharacterized protein
MRPVMGLLDEPRKPHGKAKNPARQARSNGRMKADENKALYRRFYDELMNRRNYAIVDELLSPDVVSHSPFPGQEPGPAGFKAAMRQFHEAFPDLKVEAFEFIAEDDQVMGRFRLTGTHRGKFMGKPGTGKSFACDEIGIIRIRDLRIVEHRSVMDGLQMMVPMGFATLT